MAKFRKKPVVIEAVQFTQKIADSGLDLTFEFSNGRVDSFVVHRDEKSGEPPLIPIATIEGTMLAKVGDWIICGVNGEFYPCKPDIFEKTYETV